MISCPMFSGAEAFRCCLEVALAFMRAFECSHLKCIGKLLNILVKALILTTDLQFAISVCSWFLKFSMFLSLFEFQISFYEF